MIRVVWKMAPSTSVHTALAIKYCTEPPCRLQENQTSCRLNKIMPSNQTMDTTRDPPAAYYHFNQGPCHPGALVEMIMAISVTHARCDTRVHHFVKHQTRPFSHRNSALFAFMFVKIPVPLVLWVLEYCYKLTCVMLLVLGWSALFNQAWTCTRARADRGGQPPLRVRVVFVFVCVCVLCAFVTAGTPACLE